ncbi:MAG TPA: hypothetical protein P5550_12400, partial [Bacteroidales bacterium]|nr:hypothetical protein [Bacteroidales bacterium]
MTRFVTLIFAFLFFLSGFGQSDRLVYKGEQARALIRGASEIVFDTRGQRPEYISFGKGWLMEQQDFPALLPGVMGLGKDYSLTLQGTALQDKDAIHQRLRMAYQGTPVEDGMWVAHLRQGELYALNGNLYRSILPLNQVVLTAKAART